MSDENKKKHDSVAELLAQLKRGKEVTKDELEKAITYHTSLVAELKAYKDVADFSRAEPANMKDYHSIQHELDNPREENRLKSNELKYYTENEKYKENEKSFGNSEKPAKISEENENLKSQLEKLKRDKETIQRQVGDSKRQEEHCRSDFDKLHREYEKINTELEGYRNAQSKLKDEIEKLQMDYNKVVKELEATKNAHFERKGTSEENSTEEKGHSKAMEKLKQQNDYLNEENMKLAGKVNELRNRLSVIAGHKLTDGNPEITDLSDAFRPTKIAEQFRQLYDDEWTHAFEELEEKFDTEEEIIDILADIIKDVDQFCIRAGSHQLEQLKYHAKRVIQDPEYQIGKDDKWEKWRDATPMTRAQEDLADKLLKDYRKSLGIISKNPLLEIFRQISPLIQGKLGNTSSKGLDEFLEKALSLIWVMKLQDPAMEFVWSKSGDIFDKTMYTHYTKRGNTVTQCIWPAVVLHKSGPLMSKGVVQGN